MEAVAKACCICETSLNGRKRIKDDAGDYYCPNCWEARKSFDDAREAAKLVEAAKPALKPVPRSSAVRTTPAPTPATPTDSVTFLEVDQAPTLRTRVGIFLLGLVTFADADLLPLLQAILGEKYIQLSIKMMFVGSFAMAAGLIAIFFKQLHLPWKRKPGQMVSDAEKKRIAMVLSVAVAGCLAVTLGIWGIIVHLGYQVKW